MKLRPAHRDLLKRLMHSPTHTKTFTHGDSVNSHLGFHYQRYFEEMAQSGFVVCIPERGDDWWHITEHGRKAMAEKPTVAATRKIVAGTSEGTYEGRELTQTCQRPGAYDFLKYPSLHMDKLYFPRIPNKL